MGNTISFQILKNGPLQDFKALLEHASGLGLSLDDLVGEVDAELSLRLRPLVDTQQATGKTAKQCPKCGSKNYHRGKDKFGGVTTEFMWCKSCTYSEEIK